MSKHRALLLSLLLALPVPSFALVGLEGGGFYSHLEADDAGTGSGGGALLRSDVIGIIAADVRLSYIDFSDEGIKMIPAEIAAYFRLPVPFGGLYAGLGAGYYWFDSDKVELDDSSGYFPIVGAELGLAGFNVFAEGRYLFLDGDRKNAPGSTSFDGFGFNIGVSLSF